MFQKFKKLSFSLQKPKNQFCFLFALFATVAQTQIKKQR